MSKNSLQLDFDYDFELISVISSIRDYRMCWLLNKSLNFDFIRQEDIEIQFSKMRRLSYFSLFLFEDEINFSQYYFINNKSSGTYLIPELKQVDYFLLLRGSDVLHEKGRIIDGLRSLQAVETFFEVNPNELKSKQNLIFE